MNTPRWPKTFRDEMAAKPVYLPVKLSNGYFRAEVPYTESHVRVHIDAEQFSLRTACEVRCADLNCGCGSRERSTVEDTEGDWKRMHATWCPCNRVKTVTCV